MDTSTIVILDFGSQYTQLIARRIREFNVFSVVLPCTVSLEQVKALKPKGVVLSGGPSSVYDVDAPEADPAVLAMGVPVLGICYGLQFIVHHLGGKVEPAPAREYGHAQVSVIAETPLFHLSLLAACLTIFLSALLVWPVIAFVTREARHAALTPSRGPARATCLGCVAA